MNHLLTIAKLEFKPMTMELRNSGFAGVESDDAVYAETDNVLYIIDGEELHVIDDEGNEEAYKLDLVYSTD